MTMKDALLLFVEVAGCNFYPDFGDSRKLLNNGQTVQDAANMFDEIVAAQACHLGCAHNAAWGHEKNKNQPLCSEAEKQLAVFQQWANLAPALKEDE